MMRVRWSYWDSVRSLIAAAAALTLVGGVLTVGREGHAAAARLRGVNAVLAQRRADAEGAIARGPEIQRNARALASTLARFRLADDRTRLVARFLAESAVVAGVYNVGVVSLVNAPTTAPLAGASAVISPQSPARRAAAPSTVSSAVDSEAIALDVTLEGRYADLLDATDALSRGTVPAGIHLDSLTLRDADPVRPILDAQLRVTLQRFALAEPRIPDAAAR
ncbi:MAG: hypothetical protein JOZ24_02470 [Candidatus Eremiobacteraeota bacterium]|nr:hypothetical protein [Candidatus Eremiobacteraeota bacterium]